MSGDRFGHEQNARRGRALLTALGSTPPERDDLREHHRQVCLALDGERPSEPPPASLAQSAPRPPPILDPAPPALGDEQADALRSLLLSIATGYAALAALVLATVHAEEPPTEADLRQQWGSFDRHCGCALALVAAGLAHHRAARRASYEHKVFLRLRREVTQYRVGGYQLAREVCEHEGWRPPPPRRWGPKVS